MALGFDEFTLTASTATLDDEPAARDHADAIEFRMDLVGGRKRGRKRTPADELDAYEGELPVIATNRATWEGGETDDEGRLDALARAVEFDAVQAIDVELACFRAHEPGDRDRAEALLNHAAEHETSVIVSAHDFERTPPKPELRGLLQAATEVGDVGKVAVTAQDRRDAFDLLAATHEATTAGQQVATMAMGEPGRHTRAVTPVYGSLIGYAPVSPDNATAPGQYDLATLANLVERLEARSADRTS